MHWLEVTESGDSSVRARPGNAIGGRATSAMSPLIRLSRLGLLLDAFQQDILQPFDLAPSDYAVLSSLNNAGPPYSMKPTQLYARVRRSSGGMTKILRRLETDGLVTRTPDPEDGRASFVVLTAKGRALHDRVDRALSDAAARLLSPLEPRRHQIANDALEMLLDAFERSIELRNPTHGD